MKGSRQNCYTKCFKNNWNNINSKWKENKTINITTIVLRSTGFNIRTITDPTAMSTAFNN